MKKDKGKILGHSVKEYGGNKGIDPVVLNVGAIYRGVVCFTHRLLYLWG